MRVALAKKIKAAREEGDLSENAEYHALKNEQAHLETKIARLRQRRQVAVVVEVTRAPISSRSGGRCASRICGRPGADVHDRRPDGSRSQDGAPVGESPVGKALLGAAPGDEVEVETPRGTRRWRVDALGG